MLLILLLLPPPSLLPQTLPPPPTLRLLKQADLNSAGNYLFQKCIIDIYSFISFKTLLLSLFLSNTAVS